MEYKLKALINGAEILDEQSDSASSLTGVKLTRTCGKGFQIGSTAASSLTLIILKPYKDSFDGNQIDLYLKTEAAEDDVEKTQEIEAEVGDKTEMEVVINDSTYEGIETEETEEEGEEMSEAEIEAFEAAQLERTLKLYSMIFGEDATAEDEGEEIAAPEWECIGSFYVFSQTNNADGSITLNCYDGVSKMTGDYIPAKAEGSFQEYYDDLRTQLATLGIIVDAEEFSYNPELAWGQACSYREAFGYLAGIQGGFATFGDDNTLGISYYGYDDSVIIESELTKLTWTSAGQTEIEGIECQINLSGETIEAGAGQTVKFYNPLVTAEALNKILQSYEGIDYFGAELAGTWNPAIMPGSLVKVMSEAEYANYIALQNSMDDSDSLTEDEINDLKAQLVDAGRTILVSTQTINFGGSVTNSITSDLTTESEKSNTPASPSDAKFKTVTAELIKADQLIANKADIDLANITNANVKNLAAGTIDADQINVKNINGAEIRDGTIIAAALSQSAIETFGGNKVYYQAEEPTGGVYANGDTWYQTVQDSTQTYASSLYEYRDGTWTPIPLDAEILRAGSITAQAIAGNTITASRIDMDSLQTNLAQIGNATDAHLKLSGSAIEFKYGEDVLGYVAQQKTRFEACEVNKSISVGDKYSARLTPSGSLGIYLK